MRLRTFTAPDMPSAMKMMREAMGDGAIILTTEPHKGSKGISVTAAIEKEDEYIPAAPAQHKEKPRDTSKIDQLRFEVQNILRFHNIPELFVAKMMQKASNKDLSSIQVLHQLSARHDENHLLTTSLEKLVSSYFSFDPLALDKSSLRLIVAGPPGIGKTLTVAKIAARLTMDKLPVAVVTTDNKRAGGVEQLQAFTSILGVKLHVAESQKDLVKHIQSLPARMRVLIDTAGCNPYNPEELKELEGFTALKDVEPLLLLPAGGDSLEAIDVVEGFMALPIKRILVTRTDTARRFGGVLAAAAAHGLSFCNASGSSSIIDTLQPMDGALLAQLLLRYRN